MARVKLEVGKYYTLIGNGQKCLVVYAGMELDTHKFHPYVKWGIPNENSERINLTDVETRKFVSPA